MGVGGKTISCTELNLAFGNNCLHPSIHLYSSPYCYCRYSISILSTTVTNMITYLFCRHPVLLFVRISSLWHSPLRLSRAHTHTQVQSQVQVHLLPQRPYPPSFNVLKVMFENFHKHTHTRIALDTCFHKDGTHQTNQLQCCILRCRIRKESERPSRKLPSKVQQCSFTGHRQSFFHLTTTTAKESSREG